MVSIYNVLILNLYIGLFLNRVMMKTTMDHKKIATKEVFKNSLRETGVSIAYLFGSKVVGGESPLSDVDIGVVIRTSAIQEDTRSIYQRLYEIFTELFPNSKVDIVFLQSSPLPLQYSAIKDGKILFEEDPVFTADYENGVVNHYLDFRPVLDYFDRVRMEQYAEE